MINVKSRGENDYIKGYYNNLGFSTPIKFFGDNGVEFHDFSIYEGAPPPYGNSKPIGAVEGTLMPSDTGLTPSQLKIQNTIKGYTVHSAKNIDNLNKIISAMFLNWNGALIKYGNFNTGENVIISTTPEFLAIFNNITSTLYDKVVKYLNITNRIKRQKFITSILPSNITGSNPLEITNIVNYVNTNHLDNDYEILNVLYINNDSYEKLITIANNIQQNDTNNSYISKVPDGEKLKIMVRPGGFGELSLMRLPNGTASNGKPLSVIYFRGV